MGTTPTKASPYVSYDRCQVCRRCLAQQVCKVKAIVRIDNDEPPFVDIHRCHGCMICSLRCPFGAITSV